MRIQYLLSAVLILFCCTMVPAVSALDVEYAGGFSVIPGEGFSILKVHPGGEKNHRNEITYFIIDRRRKDSTRIRQNLRNSYPGYSDLHFIEVPVDRFILLSSTFVPPFHYFQCEESIAGIDSIDNLYDTQLKSRLKRKEVLEVGNGPALNLELVLAARPKLVMVNLIEGEWNMVPRLEAAGVPVVVNGDYLESSPLGRAEWMKFFGLLLGREDEAQRRFDLLKERYQSLSAAAGRTDNRPSVTLNIPLTGSWVVPGGESYMAAFLKAAGADYLWKDSGSSSSLILDGETAFSRSVAADIWLHQYGIRSLAELAAVDGRFTRIKAFRNGQVINNDARTSSSGSNDFYESGPYQPDLILADLISIFQPELFPEHTLYYYRYLE